MKKCIYVLLISIAVTISCTPSTNSIIPPSSAKLSAFRLASNQVAGWIQDTAVADTEGYMVEKDTSLFHAIDGGAQMYVDHHVVQTSLQQMIGPNGATMESWVMDFGTTAAATAMFTDRKAKYTTSQYKPDKAYPISVAFVLPEIVSVVDIAHFDNYYFEITVTSADSTGANIAMGDQVLKVFGAIAK